MPLNESILEDAALEWFGELGYAVGHGPHLAPSESMAERKPVLTERLREAIRRLNPVFPRRPGQQSGHIEPFEFTPEWTRNHEAQT